MIPGPVRPRDGAGRLAGEGAGARAEAGRGGSAVHAVVAVVGEVGVLVRGPSGAGKTRLALALVEDARARGGFARLVADDRARLEVRGGRLVARAHPALAGLVERRGLGVGPVPHEPACVVGLAVDLVEGWPARMPEPGDRLCRVEGVTLPRVALAAGMPAGDAVALIRAAGALPGAAHRPPTYFPCQPRRDAQDCAGAERSSRRSSRHRHER